MRQRNGGGLEKVASSVSRLEERLFSNNPEYQLWKLQKAWEVIAGKAMARESFISRREDRTLVIQVTNSSWLQELMMLKQDILKRIQAVSGGISIDDIRFVTGDKWRRPKKPDFDIPGIRPPERAVSKGRVSEEEKKKIALWTEKKLPESLRKSFQGMISACIAQKRGEEEAGWHPCAGCGILCPKNETYCFSCRLRMKRDEINRIILILRDEPHFQWDEMQQWIPCSYQNYEQAWKQLVHRYKEEIYLHHDTEETRRKLACMQLHRKYEDMSDEEASRYVSQATRKQRSRWEKGVSSSSESK